MKKLVGLTGLVLTCSAPLFAKVQQEATHIPMAVRKGKVGPRELLTDPKAMMTRDKEIAAGTMSIDLLPSSNLREEVNKMAAHTLTLPNSIENGISIEGQNQWRKAAKRWNTYAVAQNADYKKFATVLEQAASILFTLVTRLHDMYGGGRSRGAHQVGKDLESLPKRYASLLKGISAVKHLALSDIRRSEAPVQWSQHVPADTKKVIPNYERVLSEYAKIKDRPLMELPFFLSKHGLINKVGEPVGLDQLERVAYIQQQKFTKSKKRAVYLSLAQDLLGKMQRIYPEELTPLDQAKLFHTDNKAAVLLYQEALVLRKALEQLFKETQPYLDKARAEIKGQQIEGGVKERRKMFERQGQTAAAAA